MGKPFTQWQVIHKDYKYFSPEKVLGDLNHEMQ